ncbi:MAG: 2OG-Fe(II) oxygenase [Alphaproteobacteria bacterium]
MSDQGIAATLTQRFADAQKNDHPYTHWLVENCLPDHAITAIQKLQFPTQDLDGVSGKRELHNSSRIYFDVENQAKHEVCKEFVEAFQSQQICGTLASTFDLDLTGSYLRVEFAQDTDGFWLEPHTDLGVKLFTMLIFISGGPGHGDLGTDIFDAERNHVGQAPFGPGRALVFVPSDTTYHGFKRRPIEGVRQSIIVNYVTDEWRAREQLAFPDARIGA